MYEWLVFGTCSCPVCAETNIIFIRFPDIMSDYFKNSRT